MQKNIDFKAMNQKTAKRLRCTDVKNGKVIDLIVFTGTEQILGKGSFGRACLARRRFENQDSEHFKQNLSIDAFFHLNNLFVVKQICCPKQFSQRDLDMYKNQVRNIVIATQDNQQSQNIVKIYPCEIINKNNYFIIMQYCDGGNLRELMNKLSKAKKNTNESLFTFFQICQIVLDLVKGLKCLRKNNIMHEDIKPQNILIKNNIIKYADFGFSFVIQHQKRQSRSGTMQYNGIQKYFSSTKKDLDHRSDIFALGIVFFQIIFGEHPFYNEQRMSIEKKKILEAQKPNLNKKNEKQYLQFIKMLKTKAYLELVCKGIRQVPLKVKCPPQYMDRFDTLIKIVKQMCSLHINNRPTFNKLDLYISTLKLSQLVDRNDIFHDLDKFKPQSVCKSLNNFVYQSSFQQAIGDPLCLQQLQKKYPNSIYIFQHEKVKKVKLHTQSLTQQIRLLSQISFMLRQQKFQNENQEWIQVILETFIKSYLYLSCIKELEFIRSSFEQMNEEQFVQYYANALECLQKLIIIDKDFLEKECFLDDNITCLDQARRLVLNHLEESLKNSILGANYISIFLKLLVYKILNSYKGCLISDRSIQQQQIVNCRNLYQLAVFDNQISIEQVGKMMQLNGFNFVVCID